MMRFLDQLLCGWLTGHDYVPRFVDTPPEKRWVCMKCWKVKQGWVVDRPKPRQRFAGDRERHQLRRTS